MEIEPTSEAWEVLSISIPSPSQRHAATSSAVNHPGLGGQVNKEISLWQYRACRAPESNWLNSLLKVARRAKVETRTRVQLRLVSTGDTLGPIHFNWDHPGTKPPTFMVSFGGLSNVRATESSGFMERAMGIEPTSGAWEVMNFPIPFSSQRHAAATSSVGQSLSSNACVRATRTVAGELFPPT